MLSLGRALTMARVALGVATLFVALETYMVLSKVARGHFPMPTLEWIPSPAPATATAYLLLAACAALAITVGFRVVLSAAASTLLSCFALFWDQQTYSNHLWLTLLLVAFLVPAHLGSPRRGEPDGVTAPGVWSTLVLMKVQLTVCYAFAALVKVNPAFLSGEPLAGWIRWDLPSWTLVLLSVGTVATELFLAAGLWFARTRLLAVALGLALHTCIVVMIPDETAALVAFTVTCVGVYPLFFVQSHADQPAAAGVAADPVAAETTVTRPATGT